MKSWLNHLWGGRQNWDPDRSNKLFNHISNYNINIQKSIVFLYISNKQLKLLRIASKIENVYE